MDIRTPIKTNGGEWLEKFGDTWKKQVEALKSRFGAAIEDVRMPPAGLTDVPIIHVKKDKLHELLSFMKSDAAFEYNFLADYTATDEMPRTPRFDLVLNLFSTTKLCRIRVKAKIGENEEHPTLIPLWAGADWAEREIFDMFGIRFTGHPDLRRILMDERYEGHPLRKDFPLRGYQLNVEPEIANPENLA